MHEIDLKPSRRLGLLLAVALLLCGAAVARTGLPGGTKALLMLAAFAVTWAAWRRALPCERLRVRADGGLQRDGRTGWEDIEVLADSFVSPALTVLRYRAADRVHALVLLADSGEASALRRLRVSLRWARHTRSDTTSQDAG